MELDQPLRNFYRKIRYSSTDMTKAAAKRWESHNNEVVPAALEDKWSFNCSGHGNNSVLPYFLVRNCSKGSIKPILPVIFGGCKTFFVSWFWPQKNGMSLMPFAKNPWLALISNESLNAQLNDITPQRPLTPYLLYLHNLCQYLFERVASLQWTISHFYQNNPLWSETVTNGLFKQMDFTML